MEKELFIGKIIFSKMPSDIFFQLLLTVSFCICTWSLLAKFNLGVPNLNQINQGIADAISTFFEESNRETDTLENGFFVVNHLFANMRFILWLLTSIVTLRLLNSSYFLVRYNKTTLAVNELVEYQQVQK
ncbi:hypothetical protein LV89_01338 [Arcicella aurantiaca]|uniref:Uncharacterized protein n=1 Tax=Arcicella aurantiaca TaxID=591202 RepID=A0A316EAV2_9BACT|nr:hypothetical protein [Arcicella aurantiaca]PWK27931.1 hypothetical protein LV89_01338 [Arcicella aurantiaca]